MFGVQFITHQTDTITYLDSVRIALEGGCRWIQLRMKDLPDAQVEETALRAQALCRSYGAVFIIDDRVELVGRLHADGVHLGRTDMPVREARRLLGPGFRIGGTANTFDAAARSGIRQPNKSSPPFWGSKATGRSPHACGRRASDCPSSASAA